MKTKIFFLSLIFVLLVSFTVTAGTPRWTSGISINPSVSQSGDTMTFQTVVKADRKSTNVFTIVAGVDGKQLFKRKFSRLQPNKTRIVRFRWKALAGDHSAYFRIVPEGQSVKKASNSFLITKKFKVGGKKASAMVRPLEVQKVKKITTTIKPVSVQQVKFEQPVCEGRPLPDIVATGISFFGIARPGEELRIQTGFANRGQCATGPFTVSLEVYVQIQSENYYQRLEVGKVTLHSLAPCREKNCGDGASKGITFKYQLLDKDYVYYDFTVVADYDNQVEEFIEDNNEIYKDLRVER